MEIWFNGIPKSEYMRRSKSYWRWAFKVPLGIYCFIILVCTLMVSSAGILLFILTCIPAALYLIIVAVLCHRYDKKHDLIK